MYIHKFENCALVVAQAEIVRWKQLNIENMSQQSDDDSDNLAVVVHQPPWRSKGKNQRDACVLCIFMLLHAGLSDFLAKLDERYNNKVKKDGTAMARKERKMGSPATSRPPEGAPRWAIDQQWIGLFFAYDLHY